MREKERERERGGGGERERGRGRESSVFIIGLVVPEVVSHERVTKCSGAVVLPGV